MRKLLIRATKELADQLEEKLRHHYDVQVFVLDDKIANVICEISADIRKKWVTICRFVPNENLDDILTMFRVNLSLKTNRL